MSDRYGEVSDAVRTSTNAVLARTVKPADAVNDIEGKLRRVMR
jgi:multiple sugar transport system substrate-binding protein